MAARKNLSHVQHTRDRIKTSMLINRLTDHIFGEVELSPSQVTAALGLIKKTLPDLKSTEVTGKDGEPLLKGITVQYVNASSDTK